jgi:hypothetical protein
MEKTLAGGLLGGTSGDALNKATHDMSTQIDGLWNLDRIRTWMHMSTKTISTWRLLLYRLRITFMISSTRVLLVAVEF